MKKLIFLLFFMSIFTIACTPKSYIRSPEVNLILVDEQQQPVKNVTVLTNSVKTGLITDEKGYVYLPADMETRWTSIFIPGGVYPVYNYFLISDHRYLPMACSCMSINTASNFPLTKITLTNTESDQSEIRKKLVEMFKEKGLAVPGSYDRTETVQFGNQVECQVYK